MGPLIQKEHARLGDCRAPKFVGTAIWARQAPTILWFLEMGLRGDGLFTVKSFYQSMLVREETTFPYSSIWIPRAPTKVCFFAWLAARGVILTAENLRKRGITLVSWCYMCKSSGEEVDHLLLHCPVSSALWRAILNLFGIQWVMPSTVKEMLYSWAGFRRRRKQKAWKFAPLALMWVVWGERNRRAFEEIESPFSHLKNSLLSLIAFWCTHIAPTCIEDWASFVENHVLM